MEMEFLANAIPRNLHWPLLGVEPPFLASKVKNPSNGRWSWTGAIWVLDQIKDHHSESEVLQVQNKCLAIADDIRTKMENDRKKFNLGQSAFVLPGLDFDSFDIDFLPLQFSQFGGVRMTFEWNTPQKKFNADAWNNETPA